MNKDWFKVAAVLLIFVLGCNYEKESYGIENLTFKDTDALKNVLIIANSNSDIRAYLRNKEYYVEVKKVNDADKAAMPSLYSRLKGELYRVHYKTDDFDLIVIANEKEVLRITPITKIKI